jgi:hypothetical protein
MMNQKLIASRFFKTYTLYLCSTLKNRARMPIYGGWRGQNGCHWLKHLFYIIAKLSVSLCSMHNNSLTLINLKKANLFSFT